MEPLTNLIVVHIPRNNAPPCLASIPLIDIDPEGIDKENYDDFEKKLGRIPDLKSHEGFRWAHRSLVSKCLGFGVGGTWEAVYMMAYGDAFVFKKEPGSHGVDEAGRARYTDMDESFVSEARNRHLAKMILRPRELILQSATPRGAGYRRIIVRKD